MAGLISTLTPEALLSSVAPSTSAVGDAAAAGTGLLASRDDHEHAREAFSATAPAELHIGSPQTAGASASPARSDHKHNAPITTNPVALAFNNAAAQGTSGETVRRDHVHGMPNVDRSVVAVSVTTSLAERTFATAFSAAPMIQVTIEYGSGGGVHIFGMITSRSATACSIHATLDTGAAANGGSAHILAMEL